MTDSKNGKGFSGFDDLVSDISKDLEEAKATTDSYPTENQAHSQSSSPKTSATQTPTTEQQTYKTTSKSGPLLDSFFDTRIYKWAIGILIVVAAIAFLNQETEKRNDNSYATRPKRVTSPAPVPSSTGVPGKPAIAPSPVLLQTISPKKEIKPSVGTNNVLSRDEIRYCLSESIRMGAMKQEVNLYEEAEVYHFNATVQDYNSRCGQFRYRQGSLESVRREVESERARLKADGALRIKKIRAHSSSAPNTEQNAQKTRQASTAK